MVNYACAFSQSESGKYFEWIITIVTNWTGKGQFEETQHDHDVLANVLLFLQRAKNNSYNTDKLPKGHCKAKLKKNDENEDAYQMLRITRVGG